MICKLIQMEVSDRYHCWGCKKVLTTFTYTEITTDGEKHLRPLCDDCRKEIIEIREGKRK